MQKDSNSIFTRGYLSFKRARALVHNLRLKNQSEWLRYSRGLMPEIGRRPANIPIDPHRVYKNKGWLSYSDWFGRRGNTKERPKGRSKFRSFYKARAFVRRLKLKALWEWEQFCHGNIPTKGQRPHDIPIAPRDVYRNNGWQGYGDWLGTGRIASHQRKFRSFKSARAFARKLHLNNSTEWTQFCQGKLPNKGKLPDDIPKSPLFTYRDKGWQGIGDWLGTGRIAPSKRIFRSFESARAFARKLQLNSTNEWLQVCQG